MTDLTDYGENQCAANFAAVATLHVALHTADPGETGASNELAVANGYARIPAAFTATGSSADNDADVVFGPATDNLGTVTHLSIWDALSGGNCWWKGPLDSSVSWPNGTITLDAGTIVATFD